MKNLYEMLEGSLKEAVEGNYIDEYHNEQELDGYLLEVYFNYNFACGVGITGADFGLCWSQYDNCLIYTHHENDDEYIDLPKTEKLIISEQELKLQLANIEIPQDFPITVFVETVQKVCNDIEQNYDAYWEVWKQTHLQNTDIQNGKEIDKANIEFIEKLFDCFDKCCNNLGFEQQEQHTDDQGILMSKTYVRQGNYIHNIRYTTINPDCTLTWTAYKDDQKVQHISFPNIVDCENIEDVFKNHLNNAIEGME